MRLNRDRLTAVLMITPSIILLAVFIYGFIGQTIWTSLSDWGTDPMNNPPLDAHVKISFVGLKNYQDLFTGLLNNRFRSDIVNTVFFTALFLVACLGLGLFMAILLDQKTRGEGVFRTIFLFPMALSFVVTGTVWRWLYQPNGGFNVLPTMIGLDPLKFQWFTSHNTFLSFTWQQMLIGIAVIIFLVMAYLTFRSWRNQKRATAVYILIGLGLVGGLIFAGAFQLPLTVKNEHHGLNVAILSLVIAATWQMSGYTMAMYLAGLRGIPEELREAARVDGCTEFQVYRFVVFPLLQPITLSAAIILGHISLKIFDLVFVMAGGNNQQVDMPSVNMYLNTFQGNNFAIGSAIAVIMLLMVAVIIIPYLVTQLRGENKL